MRVHLFPISLACLLVAACSNSSGTVAGSGSTAGSGSGADAGTGSGGSAMSAGGTANASAGRAATGSAGELGSNAGGGGASSDAGGSSSLAGSTSSVSGAAGSGDGGAASGNGGASGSGTIGTAGASGSGAGAASGSAGASGVAGSSSGGASGVGGANGSAGANGTAGAAGSALTCASDAIVFSPPPDPPCAPSGCVPKDPGYEPFEVNTFTLAVPTSIGVADFNLDQHPDLVVTGSSAFVGVGLGMFVNQGDGTFAKVSFVDTPYQFSPFTLATGDLNHDGYPDIAVSDTGGVRVFFNNQDLTFPVHPLNATSFAVNSIAIGKLDADAAPDLAIAEGNAVAVMLNHGDGTFPSEVVYPIGGSTAFAYSVALGDVDNDGDLDVAFAAQYEVGVLLNDGSGKLGAPKIYTAGHVPTDSPHAVAFAQLNGDSFVDLVATNYGSQAGSLGVFINQGDGTFAAQTSYATTANNNSSAGYHGDYRPGVGDLDGDGDVDLSVANWGAGTIGVFLNDGSGVFAAQVAYPAGSFPNSALAADFNGDGHLDLAVSTNQANGMGAAGVFFARCE